LSVSGQKCRQSPFERRDRCCSLLIVKCLMFSNCTSTNCFHVNVQNIRNTFRPKIFPFSTLLNNQLILLLSYVGFLGNDGPFLSLQVTYSFWLDRLLVTSQPRVAITGEGKRQKYLCIWRFRIWICGRHSLFS
jgi:hypothetical protein